MDSASRENKARELFSSRKYVEAAQEYAQLARDQPDCAKWLTNRAKCLLNLGKHDAALKLCRSSMRVDKGWSRGYEVAGQCLLALRRNTEAVEVLADGMRAAPSPELEGLATNARVALSKQVNMSQYDMTPSAHAHKRLPGGEGPQTGFAGMPPHIQQLYRRASKPDKKLLLQSQRHEEVMMRAAALEQAGRIGEAIPLLERSAREGCTAAMSGLARVYLNLDGEGQISDPPKGVEWARRCIEHGPAPHWRILGQPDAGLAMAQELLGTAYHHGLGGLARDPQQAERWLRAAADAGDPLALNNLAVFLQELGRPDEEAFALYRHGAALGYARAMLNVGMHLKEGLGCGRDPVEAAVWLHMAAEQGDLMAVAGLVSLAKEQATSGARVAMLEATRRHVQAARGREEDGRGGGARGSTLAMEAGLCLEMQRARDAGMSQGDLVAQLGAAADPLTPVLLSGGMSLVGSGELGVDEYRAFLLDRLGCSRLLTDLETEAAQLAKRAGETWSASVSASYSGPPWDNPETIAEVLVDVGRLFQAKGMEDEAHARFLLPAAKMGNPTACFLAGRYLAQRGGLGKDLRAAQRYLSQAAARGVAAAQGELDAMTRRLAKGDSETGSAVANDGNRDDDNHDGADEEDKAAGLGIAAAEGARWGAPGAATKSCWDCGERAESLRRCAGCRLAEYCSRECQKKHWKAGHREACAKLAT